MPVFKLFSSLYQIFSRRRRWLFGGVLLLVLAGVFGIAHLDMREDIEAMLPDGGSRAAADFHLLQQAPFSRKVLVNLQAGPRTDTAALLAAADRLAAMMTPPLFSSAVSGPAAAQNGSLLFWLTESLPNLVTDADMEGLSAGLTRENVQARLEENYARLLSPEGWFIKPLVTRDPLEFRTLALEKLLYLNPISKTRLQDNHFLSADGKNALIIAETPVPITDSKGGRGLLEHFQSLVKKTVPQDIEVTLVSGHRYTVANAEAIQGDLFIVLGISSLAILALFILFLRSWRAVFVFMMPLCVLGLAASAVSLVYDSVSGVTIGFGAVLLGITVDFGLHVYFGLRHGGADRAAILGSLARPILFGGVTTLGAFGVLLFSDLPGQRQLAVFSMAGIALALLLSLIVLPHLVGPVSLRGRKSGRPAASGFRCFVIGGWLVLLALCGWQAVQVRINGELRNLSSVPKDVHVAERHLQDTWGNLRSQAMIFVEGSDMQTALEANDRLFQFLKGELPNHRIVSLAPLLPPIAAQDDSWQRWTAFWAENRGIAEGLLQENGAVLGFSKTAFKPFADSLDSRPAVAGLESMHSSGLGPLLDALILKQGGKVRILTLVPDTPEVVAIFSGENQPVPGAHLVSQTRFGREVGEAISHDFVRFITLACLVVGFLLACLFRSVKKVFLALLPVITGLVVMFGVMGWFGLELNLFNVVATILVIGLGVDYGIFMVCRISEGFDHATGRAVLVSGLTTLAGFGALVFARHPALHSIGATVLLGIGAAVPAALLVIPALYRKEGR